MRFALLFLLVSCSSSPKPTGTVCPDPDPMTLTYDNFGRDFMTKYCTVCHSSELTRSQRNGAPLYHDFDSLLGVLQTADHVDEQAGNGPDANNNFMPPERCPSTPGGSLDRNCPQPTADERTKLAEWIACERNRPHNFVDARVDAP
jgi:uncharacterized membrane protein